MQTSRKRNGYNSPVIKFQLTDGVSLRKSLLEKVVFVVPSIVIGAAIGILFDRKVLRPSTSQNRNGDGGSAAPKKSGRHSIMKGGSASWKSGNSSSVPSASNERMDNSELKMVLVVRVDLKMGTGKIAAQCAHAAVGVCGELLTKNKSLLRKYEDCGQPKIVVSCSNQSEMNELKGKAQGLGLPTYIVSDAGRTQVAAGSKTVLAIGPGPKSTVDIVTRHLKLL